MITIALSKGRIYKETLPLLAAADIVPADDPDKSRKLILDTNHDDVKLLIIRATDVPTYVQFGAADLGVAGKDVLLEHGGEGLYEPLDLKIAKCKLMTAGLVEPGPRLSGRLLLQSLLMSPSLILNHAVNRLSLLNFMAQWNLAL